MSVERSFAITRFQMIIGFAIYMSCDINNLAPINIDVFLEKVQEYDFTHVLFSKLEESGVTNDNFSQHSIDQVVTEELQEFYKYLDMND